MWFDYNDLERVDQILGIGSLPCICQRWGRIVCIGICVVRFMLHVCEAVCYVVVKCCKSL